jgi:tRNA threonylcarbamoyl adenosine modification protein (Sua5/YciO/YrdC/YwlC family)
VDAFIADAIQQLYVIKERDLSRAVPILLGEISHLNQLVGVMSFKALRAAEAFWPGPLTLVVPRHPALPDILAPGETIGVRMPDHVVALSLLKRTGPLAVTSANISGAPSPRTAREVFEQLGGRIPLILDGGTTTGGIPSTVIDCTGEEIRIIRQGPVSLQEINALFA